MHFTYLEARNIKIFEFELYPFSKFCKTQKENLSDQ